jgi:hypothetical protein
MFNFLNSAVLIAAAAALIPLLIHLFSKRQVKVVPFSSLKHLKEMQKRQVRRIKIRQLLLLILRMMIILAAVLAFARPATRGGYIGSHAGVSSVILFDRSASMNRQVKDGRLFDLAKTRASEILKNFGQNDQVILIPFDRETYFPAGQQFFSRDIAANILGTLTPGYDSGNIGEALKKGIELLSGTQMLNKELYLISDCQQNSFPEKLDSLPANIAFYLVELPVETDGNCGAVGVDMGGQLIEVGSEFTIKAEIANYDNRTKNEQLVSLFIDEARVSQSEFSISPKGKETVTFKSAVATTGFHSGYIEIGDDAFPADNRFYFSFRIPEQFNILIVSGDQSGELIGTALVPDEALARYWSVKTITPDQVGSIRWREYDAVVLAGIRSLGQVETSQLIRYISGGGGLLFVPGPALDLQYYNENFGNKCDLLFLKAAPAEFSGAGYYALEGFDYGHPILAPFSEYQGEPLPSYKFYALPTVKDGNANRDLARFSNGQPAISEAAYGQGKIITITGLINPEYSDLTAHSFFVPFTIRTTEYLAGNVSSYEFKNLVGHKVIRTVAMKEDGPEALTMMAPDGKNYTIAGSEKSGQFAYECRPIDWPGIYQLREDNRLYDLFPVNIVSSEGDLASLDFDKITSRPGLGRGKIVSYNRPPTATITESRFGRELWKIFLWAAAVLLAVEIFLSREKSPAVDEA